MLLNQSQQREFQVIAAMSEEVGGLSLLAFPFGTVVDHKGYCIVLINLDFLSIRMTGYMDLLCKIRIIEGNCFK